MAAAECSDNLWPSPPDAVELNDDEVHVWLVNAGAKDIPQDLLATSLSEDEKERAARFKFVKDRRLYIAAHAALRSLLANTCELPRTRFNLSQDLTANPRSLRHLPPAVWSSISPTPTRSALVAVARQRAVGVDVEFVKREFSFDELARRFFTTKEVAALCELPQTLQREAFFKCWTSKEAFLKAKGTGLSGKLDEVAITLAADQQVRINASVPDWSLTELTLCVGYQGALVVQGDPRPIRCYQWESPLIDTRQ